MFTRVAGILPRIVPSPAEETMSDTRPTDAQRAGIRGLEADFGIWTSGVEAE